MGLLGKRASAEDVASTSNVALLVNGFKDLELSRSDGRKTLTAEVLKTLDEEVTFLVRSSDLSSGKYYGCSWSKAMLEALDPSVWILMDVHKAFRASRIKPIADQGQEALPLTGRVHDGESSKEVLANVVVLHPLLALDDIEIALLHRGVLARVRGSPIAPADLLGATTIQLSHVHLVASALKIESLREAIDEVLTSEVMYAAIKKRRREFVLRSKSSKASSVETEAELCKVL